MDEPSLIFFPFQTHLELVNRLVTEDFIDCILQPKQEHFITDLDSFILIKNKNIKVKIIQSFFIRN